jgi:aspartate racemase
MRTIGLVGGFSWHATAAYYRFLNEGVAQRLGGHSSAQVALRSLDFARVLAADEHVAGRLIAEAARDTERAGADMVLLAANTAHRWAEVVERSIAIPLLHIGDATAERVGRDGIARVGVLGTRETMEGDFLIGRLRERHGLDVTTPGEQGRDALEALIRTELMLRPPSAHATQLVTSLIEQLLAHGAEGVLLACTELTLVDLDRGLPTYDTAAIHADAGVALALEKETR